MSESVREMLAREAEEAEARADAEDRGAVTPKPGQRARPPREASQVYSLRLPSSAIAHLREIAEQTDEPPTALLRRFVLERLAHETRRQEPVDVVASAVDDLMPLVRQRLMEAAHQVKAPPAVDVVEHAKGSRSKGVNLGPARREKREASAAEEVSA